MSGNVITLFQTNNSSTWNTFAVDNTAYYISNLEITGGTLTIGNSTVNVVINSTFFGPSGGYGGGNLLPSSNNAIEIGNSTLVYSNLSLGGLLSIGNSTSNVTVNSSFFSGEANNTLFVGTVSSANVVSNAQLISNLALYSLLTGAHFTGDLNVGSNVILSVSGLLIGNSTVNTITNSTVFTGTSNNSTNFAGQGQAFYANVTTPVFSVSVNVGSNVSISNLGSILLGNSTVNSTINSTVYSGTSNNATNLGGEPLSYFANTSAPVFSGHINVGSNVVLNTISLTIGNSTFSTQVGNEGFQILGGYNVGGVVTLNATTLFLGNTTVNSTINSTFFSGEANTVAFIGSTSAANVVSNAQLQANLLNYAPLSNLSSYAPLAGADFTGDINVGSNVVISSSGLSVGNTTVNTFVNSTAFTGTANNVNFVGSTAVGNVVSNAQLIANLANYALIAGEDFTGDVNIGSNVVISVNQIYVGNSTENTVHTNSGLYTLGGITGGNVSLNGSVLFLGNSTVNALVNSTVFTGTANNTLFVGSVSAVNVVSNTQLVANLANYALITGTVNSALFIGSTSAANVVTDTQLAQNLTAYALITGDHFTGDVNVGSNVVLSTSNLTIGNSTVNATMNSSVFTGLSLTANNALFLGGKDADVYLNNTDNFVVGGLFSFVANLSVNSVFTANGFVGLSGQVLTSGGPGQNVFWSTVESSGGGNGGGSSGPIGSSGEIAFNESGTESGDPNLTWSSGATQLTVGNSTSNATLNSIALVIGTATLNATSFTGTANDTLFVGSVSAINVVSNAQLQASLVNFPNTVQLAANLANYTNTAGLSGFASLTGADFSGDVNVGSNVILSTAGLLMGNTTVNASINSTVFTGTSNNTLFVGTLSTINVVSNAQLQANLLNYPNTVQLAANLSNYPNTIQLAANLANYTNTAGLTGFALLTGADFTGDVNVGSNVVLTLTNITVGNTTINAVYSNTGLTVLGGIASGNSAINQTGIFIGNTTSNVQANNTTVSLGNSTINATINSTIYSATSNNTLFVGSVSAANIVSNTQLATNLANYALIAGQTFTGDVNVGSNVVLTLSSVAVGNSTVNTIISNGGLSTLSGVTLGNLSINGSALFIGNSTVSSLVNSTFFTGTANNVSFVGTTSAANVVSNTLLTQNLAHYALIAGQTFTGDVNVGSNVVISLTNIVVGNSTVNTTIGNTGISTLGGITLGNSSLTEQILFIGNSTVSATVNSTVFTGTANNTSFVGATAAANVVSNAQLVANLVNFPNTIQLAANLANYPNTVNLSQNLALYSLLAGATFTGDVNVGANVVMSLNGLLIGNSTVNTTHTNSGLFILGGETLGNVTLNSSSLFLGNSTVFTTITSALAQIGGSQVTPTNFQIGNTSLNSTALFIGNSTVNVILNSTTFSGISNNATNLGGVGAASYLTNTGNFSISGLYSFIANLSVNGVIIANGGAGGSGQVLTSGGSLTNAYWSTVTGGGGATSPGGSNTQIQFNESASFGGDANLTWNWASEFLQIGNSTVNSTLNSTSFFINGGTINSTVYTGTSNNTSFVGATAAANVVSNTQLTQNLANYALIAGQTFTGDVNVGSNVVISTSSLGIASTIILGNSSLNATALSIGNATVGITVNSTFFTGTSNNVSFVGATAQANVVSNAQLVANLANYPNTVQLASNLANYPNTTNLIQNLANYALIAGQTFTGDVNVGSNVVMTLASLSVGNSTVNTIHTNSGISTLSGVTLGNLNINGTALFIGNSTVSATVNSTIFSGTSNNVLFVGAIAQANVVSNTQLTQNLALYSLLTGAQFSGAVNVGANVVHTLTNIVVGNSTVNTTYGNAGLTVLGGFTTGNVSTNSTALFIGNSTVSNFINSTSYTGIANNTLFVGATSQANVVSNAQLVANLANFPNTIQLAANLANYPNTTNLTQNLANYALLTGALFSGSVNVGSNLIISTSSLLVGNTSINANQNLLANAGFFAGPSFTQLNAPLAIENFEGPASIIDASLMVCAVNGTGSYGFFQTLPTAYWVSGNSYTIQLAAKPANSNFVAITLESGIGWWAAATFNVSTGATGQTSNGTLGGAVTSSSITALKNGWFLCTMTATIANTQAANVIFSLAANAALVNFSTQGIPQLTTPTANQFSVYVDYPFIGDGGWAQLSNTIVNSSVAIISSQVGNSTVSSVLTSSLNSNNILVTQLSGANSFTAHLSSKRMLIFDSFGNTFFVNSGSLSLGNSTVNSTVNSTSFTGQANNTLFVGTVSAINVVSNTQLSQNLALYALLAGAAFTGQVNVGANINLTTTGIVVGNSTVNTTHVNSGLFILGGVTTGNVTLNASTLFLGNSTVNTVINSSTVSTPTANQNVIFSDSGFANGSNFFTFNKALFTVSMSNSLSVGSPLITGTAIFGQSNTAAGVIGQSNSWYGLEGISNSGSAVFLQSLATANIATFSNSSTTFGAISNLGAYYLTGGITLGNVTLNSISLFLGNSTVNALVNSTVFSGISNNVNFVGATAQANVVSNAQLVANLANYTNTAGLSIYAPLAGAVFTGVVNVHANLAVTGAIFANGSNGAVNQVLTSAGVGPAFWATPSGGAGGPIGSTTQIAFNNAGTEAGDANLTWTTASALLTVGNSTVNSTLNSTMYTVNYINTIATIYAPAPTGVAVSDTANLIAAFSSLGTTNFKEIILAPGTYVVNQAINFYGNGVTIRGSGKISTTISNPSGTGVLYANGFFYSRISDMTLSGGGGVPNLLSFINSSNSTFALLNPSNMNLTTNLASNLFISPDGTNNCVKLASSNTTSSANAFAYFDSSQGGGTSTAIPNISSIPLVPGQTYTLKGWFKPGNSNFVALQLTGGGGGVFGAFNVFASAIFNVSTGVVGPTANGTSGGTVVATGTVAGSGGFWCWMECTFPSSGLAIQARYMLVTSNTAPTYQGSGNVAIASANNNLSVYLWNPQLQKGTVANCAANTDIALNLNPDIGVISVQSSQISNMLFTNCYDGIAIGLANFEADTSSIINCNWGSCAHAGVGVYNFNALCWNIYGGNALQCLMGVYTQAGSVPVIQGLGCEINEVDICMTGGASDGILISGIRTESSRFVYNSTGNFVLQGIQYSPASSNAFTDFMYSGGGNDPASFIGCTSWSNYAGIFINSPGTIIDCEFNANVTNFVKGTGIVKVFSTIYGNVTSVGAGTTIHDSVYSNGAWLGKSNDGWAFSQIPAASAAIGQEVLIFDANTAISVGTLVTSGGGSNVALLYSNGTNWIVMGGNPASGGAGGPIGSTTQIAFNNAGTEAGDAKLTWQTSNTLLTIGNSTANISANSITLEFANSTQNLIINNSVLALTGPSGAGATYGPAGMFFGNNSANTLILPTNFNIVNTGAYATAKSNGSYQLPGGGSTGFGAITVNWGWVNASSTIGAVTFTTAYGTNAFVVMATGSSNLATHVATVTAWTATGCTIETANATANTVYYLAIGV